MNWYKTAQSKTMLGYKVMRVENGELVSGANSRLTLPMQIGIIHSMPGHGIYMGKSPEYVKDYYSSSEDPDDPKEVLITYQFDIDDVTHGNLEDREWEISVPQAKVINIEAIN